mmetsp:Transcript_13177/g.55345  ORF Transcript_13177/g.55345 Transcript_13177/m.55345 type:complete len:436 (+) Transcript_13177:1348-2655(+)
MAGRCDEAAKGFFIRALVLRRRWRSTSFTFPAPRRPWRAISDGESHVPHQHDDRGVRSCERSVLCFGPGAVRGRRLPRRVSVNSRGKGLASRRRDARRVRRPDRARRARHGRLVPSPARAVGGSFVLGGRHDAPVGLPRQREGSGGAEVPRALRQVTRHRRVGRRQRPPRRRGVSRKNNLLGPPRRQRAGGVRGFALGGRDARAVSALAQEQAVHRVRGRPGVRVRLRREPRGHKRRSLADGGDGHRDGHRGDGLLRRRRGRRGRRRFLGAHRQRRVFRVRRRRERGDARGPQSARPRHQGGGGARRRRGGVRRARRKGGLSGVVLLQPVGGGRRAAGRRGDAGGRARRVPGRATRNRAAGTSLAGRASGDVRGGAQGHRTSVCAGRRAGDGRRGQPRVRLGPLAAGGRRREQRGQGSAGRGRQRDEQTTLAVLK